MKLSELNTRFLKIEDEHTYAMIDDIKKADGISFLCPLCYKNNGNSSIGVHSMICWQPHVPQTFHPNPGRWNFQGTGLGDLTLVNGSSSILIQGGCKAHFWIRNGEIQWK